MKIMENAEEIQLILERYTKTKPKEIPEELEGYLRFVASSGDTVFKWPQIQHLLREKLLNVITEFHETTPSIQDLPHYPNVDPFNFESMKKQLLERMDSFSSAPFTVQRICELLTEPRKQYSRIDKFMRAIEKTILVVSCVEPNRKRNESENGESLDSTLSNGEPASDVEVENDHAAANGKKEKHEPAAKSEVADIEVPLEKLEPEVSVLTSDDIPAVVEDATPALPVEPVEKMAVEETPAPKPVVVEASSEVIAAEKPIDEAADVPKISEEPCSVVEPTPPTKVVEEPKPEEMITGNKRMSFFFFISFLFLHSSFLHRSVLILFKIRSLWVKVKIFLFLSFALQRFVVFLSSCNGTVNFRIKQPHFS